MSQVRIDFVPWQVLMYLLLPHISRWQPIVPLGKFLRCWGLEFVLIPNYPVAFPHQVDTEDIYRGYRIPKNSVIIPNVWYVDLSPQLVWLASIVIPSGRCFATQQYMGLMQMIMNPSDGFSKQMAKDGSSIPTCLTQLPWVLDLDDGSYRIILWCYLCDADQCVQLIRICPGKHLALSLFWISVVSLLHSFDISQTFDGAGNPIKPKGEYVSGVLKYVDMFPYRCLSCFLSPPFRQHSYSIWVHNQAPVRRTCQTH